MRVIEFFRELPAEGRFTSNPFNEEECNSELRKNYGELYEKVKSLSLNAYRGIFKLPVGVEIETENVFGATDTVMNYWVLKEDGSLRKNGKEFITSIGTVIGELPFLLHEFNKSAKQNKYSFSERTSVHVHLDARNMDEEDVLSLIALYTVFEESLFNFAGAARFHNIFTVPVTSSNKVIVGWKQGVFKNIAGNIANKYSALNLKSIQTHGTVEFRHMEGNSDPVRILSWVLLLASLRRFAIRAPAEQVQKEICELKFLSNYMALRDKVFGPFSNLLSIEPKQMDRACSDAKLFFHNEVKE